MSLAATGFDIQEFRCPSLAFAPVYAWVWNSVCTEEIIDGASKILADKLARSKKGKAILEGLGEQE